jgi:hypothetical protein
MDLIRLQLLCVEGEEPMPELNNYTEGQRICHMALCIEAGLVDGVVRKNEIGEPNGCVAIRLTWKGHEFLDAARNDTIWKKALGHIKKAGVQVTLPVLEEVLKKAAKELLGLQ